MYRLDNTRVREVALACSECSGPHHAVSVVPEDWKKYYAFIIEVEGEKLAIVPLARLKVSNLVRAITDVSNAWQVDPATTDYTFTDDILFGLYLMVYNNTAYYSPHPIVQKLKLAVVNKIRPSVCAVLY
jgi:hypothetical protein